MKTRHQLTLTELEQIGRYLDDGGATPPEETIFKLRDISSALERKLSEDFRHAQNKVAMLEKRLQTFRDKRDRALKEGTFVFDETGFDSVNIAYALIYCLQRLETYRLTKTKVVLILYEMYTSWLHSKKERLFIEHPVATEWGPHLWRVYKRISTVNSVPRGVFEEVAKQNPGVAAFTQNAAKKYHDYAEKQLKDYFMKSTPYRNALPASNGGKWNKEISDSDIYLWRAATCSGL